MKTKISRLTKINNGVRLVVDFDNGYGASIVCHDMSYGGPLVEGERNVYELAVLHNGHLCYDTPITDDVLGWLTIEEINEALKEIEKL